MILCPHHQAALFYIILILQQDRDLPAAQQDLESSIRHLPGAIQPTNPTLEATHPTYLTQGATHPTYLTQGATHPTYLTQGATHPTYLTPGDAHPATKPPGAIHPSTQPPTRTQLAMFSSLLIYWTPQLPKWSHWTPKPCHTTEIQFKPSFTFNVLIILLRLCVQNILLFFFFRKMKF